MARFGQGIMPQLGAINYSPILQGSLAAAEGQMRGSEAVARGIAALGSGIGQGMERYEQNRQQTKQADAVIKSADQQTKALRSILPYLGEDISKTLTPTLDSLQAQISDPSLSAVQKAAIAQQGISGFGQILNLGLEAQSRQEAAARPGRQASALEAAGAPASVVAAVRSGVPFEDAIKLAPKTPNKAVDPVSYRSQDQKGNPIEITVDRLTGKEIGRGPVREPPKVLRTPEEEAEAAAMTAESKAEAESSVKFLDTLSEQAAQAQQNAPRFARLRQLLESPVTNTGALEEYRTVVRGLATQLGAKDETLADQQAMEALLAEDALLETRRLLSGQGSVTEAERGRIDKLALSAGRSRAALLELLGFRDAALTRSLEAENRRIELIEQGVKPRDAAKVMRRWMRDNPVSAFIPAGGEGNDEASIANAFEIARGKR